MRTSPGGHGSAGDRVEVPLQRAHRNAGGAELVPRAATPELTALSERDNDDRDYVNSLARGLTVIRAFNRSRPSMTLSDVARRTGINRAATRRFLLTLVREGYAETDGKYFRLRPKILELGFSALSSMTFSELAQPIIEELAESLDEVCLAAVLDGEWVVYTNRTSTQRVVSVDLGNGSRLPAFCTSTGRILLAALPDGALDRWLDEVQPVRYTERTIVSKRRLREEILRARRQGWSIVEEEYEVGLGSLSVPIRDRVGATIAALNVCCPTPRVTLETMQSIFLPRVQEAAEAIRASLARADAAAP
jgi:IclR family pca regulon transcriptional regulator